MDKDHDLSAENDENAANVQRPKLALFGFIGHELGWGSALAWARPASRGGETMSSFLRVPVSMERFLFLAHALAADLFLFHFTLLPLRMFWSILTLVATLVTILLRLFTPRTWWVPVKAGGSKVLNGLLSLHISRAGVYDVLKVAMLAIATVLLGTIQVARVYHYIKGEAVIKLYVIFNILEIVDKLCASVGTDIMDKLYRTLRDDKDLAVFGEWLHGGGNGQGSWRPLLAPLRLAWQVLLAIIYVTFHAAVIFVHVVCLNVALNSRNNALLTLLISNNFVELKGNVFKRFEPANLFQIACADAVERFQLSLYLSLIILQEGASSELLGTAAFIWCAEMVVDAVKHSFVCKFNRLHADLYGTFTAIVAHDFVSVRGRMTNSLDPTHACVRRLGLSPLPLACVLLRVVFTNVHPSWFPRAVTSATGFVALALMLLSVALVKLSLGMMLLAYCGSVIHAQRGRLVQAAHKAQLAALHAASSPRNVSTGSTGASSAAPRQAQLSAGHPSADAAAPSQPARGRRGSLGSDHTAGPNTRIGTGALSALSAATSPSGSQAGAFSASTAFASAEAAATASIVSGSTGSGSGATSAHGTPAATPAQEMRPDFDRGSSGQQLQLRHGATVGKRGGGRSVADPLVGIAAAVGSSESRPASGRRDAADPLADGRLLAELRGPLLPEEAEAEARMDHDQQHRENAALLGGLRYRGGKDGPRRNSGPAAAPAASTAATTPSSIYSAAGTRSAQFVDTAAATLAAGAAAQPPPRSPTICATPFLKAEHKRLVAAAEAANGAPGTLGKPLAAGLGMDTPKLLSASMPSSASAAGTPEPSIPAWSLSGAGGAGGNVAAAAAARGHAFALAGRTPGKASGPQVPSAVSIAHQSSTGTQLFETDDDEAEEEEDGHGAHIHGGSGTSMQRGSSKQAAAGHDRDDGSGGSAASAGAGAVSASASSASSEAALAFAPDNSNDAGALERLLMVDTMLKVERYASHNGKAVPL